jgi:digeranylgeranylglycerophospholipid reductase
MNDVIVIGAGPAGTACAKNLAENGFSVKVYDKRAEIGSPKRCGEGLSEASQNFTCVIPERCIAQKVKGSRMYPPNGRYVDAISPEGGFVLERKVFDKWLAEEAVKAGAQVQANTFVSCLLKDSKGCYAGVKGEFLGNEFEEKAKVVVCATGAASPLRNQTLGVFSKASQIYSCIQFEMANIDIESDFIHFFFFQHAGAQRIRLGFPQGQA